MTFVDPIWVLANPHHRQGLELKTRCEQPSRSYHYPPPPSFPSPPLPLKKNQTNIQTKQNKPKKKKNAVNYYKVTNTKVILDLGGKS